MHLKRTPSARQMAVTELDLVSFTSLVRGIKFYNVSTSAVCVGDFVSLCPEPYNPHDNNCIAVWMGPRMLGHLSRDVACCLAPLMSSGVSASGYVILKCIVHEQLCEIMFMQKSEFPSLLNYSK